MLEIVPSGQILGATLYGVDVSQPLAQPVFDKIFQALGDYGVLRFPQQTLTGEQLVRFSQRFGHLEVNVANSFQEPGLPEIMILSNIVENGKPVGLSDAGQSWHTDMSYSRTIAFANVLYGIKIPRREGRTLGNTQFCNMHAAYEGLPIAIKKQLEGKTILHDFNKFWDMMRREKGSQRPALTEAQRLAKPPVSHPAVLIHPLTGKKVLYANPGYCMRINEMPEQESQQLLDFLFEHQTQPCYLYSHTWEESDLMLWEDIGTIHNAVADYRSDEPRLIKRCQVMANTFGQSFAQP
ncbi:MAG: TauD/TfdA family dioxygenase [Betaproteobacteria bacterium]|jgi:taurine dioxygenase